MVKRICFLTKPTEKALYSEIEIEFDYYSGFALSQKQKSIESMHQSIKKMNKDLKIMEISTKSTNRLGVELSAFNLKYFDEITQKEYPIENVFQSSKVFQNGGPFRDLLNVHPKEAKRDNRLKNSGDLIWFDFNNIIWELEPKTMFYDWIYINALFNNKRLAKEILNFNAFTDIEFNHNKSINCQARSAAIFVSLSNLDTLIEAITNKDEFRKIYEKNPGTFSQVSLF